MALEDMKRAMEGHDEEDEGSEADEPEHAEAIAELGDILGLDEDKSKRLCEVICALVHAEENEEGDEGEEPMPKKKGKGSIALILGH